MREPRPPRQYAEQVLGRAVTSEQLDEMFVLHAATHPVVRHQEIDVSRKGKVLSVPCCVVALLTNNPNSSRPGGNMGRIMVEGQAMCGSRDQWNRRLGVTIAFGRALKQLRVKVR